MAAGLFYNLKTLHVEVELATEYAKDLVFANRRRDLEDQVYVFGKQQYRIQRLAKECQVIITDSPVLMGLVYAPDYPQCFRETVAWRFNQFPSINFYIERTSTYKALGRTQTEEQAREKDAEIKTLLGEFGVDYHIVTGNDEGLADALSVVRQKLDL